VALQILRCFKDGKGLIYVCIDKMAIVYQSPSLNYTEQRSKIVIVQGMRLFIFQYLTYERYIQCFGSVRVIKFF